MTCLLIIIIKVKELVGTICRHLTLKHPVSQRVHPCIHAYSLYNNNVINNNNNNNTQMYCLPTSVVSVVFLLQEELSLVVAVDYAITKQ